MVPVKRILALCGQMAVLVFKKVLLQKISVGYIGTNTMIDCPFQGDYTFLSWQGPPFSNGIATEYYDRGSGLFNPVLQNRYSWADNSRSLILTGIIGTDNGGIYTCSARIGSSLMVANNTLNVRVRPSVPEITTSAPEDSNGVRATEGRSLVITCTSRGGYPAPTVALYLGNITEQKLAETSTGTPTGDTFTVTVNYSFVSTRLNDRRQLVCRSYYPTPTDAQDPQQTQAKLFLYLKPQSPSVTQLADVIAGGDVAVECRTIGSRPAVTIKWGYLGQIHTPDVSATLDNSTQTFTTVSVLRRSVTPAENGQTVQCKVTHQALNAAITETKTLNVKFAANSSSTTIKGNKPFTATGSNPLNLTCITGTSNPASTIVWRKDNIVISSNSPYSETSGQYNGIVRSQVLTLYPNRGDDEVVVTCSVSNGVEKVTDTASFILDLLYRPIVTIRSNPRWTIVEQTSAQSIELPCSVDSKPLSNVTWRHNGHEVKQDAGVSFLSYSISNPSRISYGDYTCTADNGVAPVDSMTYAVEVLFRPLGITIIKPESIIADGSNKMSISCVTDSSNPSAVVTWSTGSIGTPMPIDTQTLGQYGGTVLNSTITFTPDRSHDGAKVSCAAKNDMFSNHQVSNNTSIDNIKYSPWISLVSEKTVTEGDRVVLNCSASSKPSASFRWADDTETVAIGNGTARHNGLDYIITNVSRTQGDAYTCFSDNQIPPIDSKQTTLVVQYPPDVVVIAVNATVRSHSTTVTCVAAGVPDRYTYEGWLHTWNGHIVLRQEPLPATRELNLTGLSYAHSGVYRCGASNGIKGVVSHGEECLLVKSFPVMIGEIANSKKIKANGQLMKPTVVTFQYYSNTDNSSVKVLKANDTVEEVGEVHQRIVNVTLPVFLSEIMTPGIEVTINITMVEESQFGDYTIVVTNEIDNVNLTLIIQPKGPPETPIFVNSTAHDHHTVEITWISGFPNGLNQTFVIQISTDNNSWQNTMQDGGMSFQKTRSQIIKNLASGQLYFVRLLAVNGKGDSEPTATFSFQTLPRPDPDSSTDIGLIVGGAAGGTMAALVVVAIIIFIERRRRKEVKSSLGKQNTDKGVEIFGLEGESNHGEPRTAAVTTESMDAQPYEALNVTRDTQCYDQLQANRTDNPQHVYENNTVSPYKTLQRDRVREALAYDQLQFGVPDQQTPVYENLKLTAL